MIYLIVLFYEYYIYEFLILNDFYKIALYINYHRHHNILYILHLHNKKLVDCHNSVILIRLLEMIYINPKFLHRQ